MFKKDMWQSIVFELIFWKIKFNNSFNNTVQHTYVLLKHVVLEVRQYVPSQNHVMFHRISNAEIIALRFNHLLALLLRVNEPSLCVLFIFHSCNLSPPHLRLTLVTQNSIHLNFYNHCPYSTLLWWVIGVCSPNSLIDFFIWINQVQVFPNNETEIQLYSNE